MHLGQVSSPDARPQAYHKVLGRPHDGSLWKEKEMRGPGHLRLKKAASGETCGICTYDGLRRREKSRVVSVITVLGKWHIRL